MFEYLQDNLVSPKTSLENGVDILYLVATAIVFLIMGLFVRNFLPSYFNEKGKNLATKEDIKEITNKTLTLGRKFMS